MSNYSFVFTKSIEIVIEASSEDEAWTKIAQINPETLGAEWEVAAKSTLVKEEIPIDQGPVEIDDWGQFDQF
jgi:hypothetical protein